jgi:hypothetical protein
MPRVFVISSHGSMPMIDDDSVVLPKLPDFTKKPSASANKKTAQKSIATVFKTPVLKTPDVKKNHDVKKTPVIKKNVSKKSASAAPPLGLGFTAPPLGVAFTSPPLGVTFAAMGALKKPVSFTSPVDTFTTAKCGQPFCADLRCDAPYVGLVHNLSQYRLPSHVPKDTVRAIIKQVMLAIKCDPRHAHALIRAENKIRCHKIGSQITELFLFSPSHELPILESVTMVDMETGEIQDAHEMFGLVKKHAPASRPHGAAAQYDMAGLQYAKQRAEWDLRTLQGVNPFYVDMKKEHIKTIDDTIACNLKESRFEYSAESKAKHGDRIKLSDLLTNGMSNGLNPATDFVVVYACRVPDEHVLGAIRSPRGSDSDASEGGTRSNQKQKSKSKQRYRRKTCKRRS